MNGQQEKMICLIYRFKVWNNYDFKTLNNCNYIKLVFH